MLNTASTLHTAHCTLPPTPCPKVHVCLQLCCYVCLQKQPVLEERSTARPVRRVWLCLRSATAHSPVLIASSTDRPSVPSVQKTSVSTAARVPSMRTSAPTAAVRTVSRAIVAPFPNPHHTRDHRTPQRLR